MFVGPILVAKQNSPGFGLPGAIFLQLPCKDPPHPYRLALVWLDVVREDLKSLGGHEVLDLDSLCTAEGSGLLRRDTPF